MRHHFSISYSGGFEPISEWLRRQAAENPLLALDDDAHGQFAIVVTASPEIARWQQEQLNAGRTVLTGACVIEVVPKLAVIVVNQECGEYERAAMANLIRELLKQFPNWSIYDEDTRAEITDLVHAEVGELFDS